MLSVKNVYMTNFLSFNKLKTLNHINCTLNMLYN